MGTKRVQDRGISIKHIRLWLLQRFGKDGLDRLSKRIPPQTKEILEKPVPHHWYPKESIQPIFEAIEEEFASQDSKVMFDLGGFMAKRSMVGFLKYMVRLVSVEQVIARIHRIWLRYHDSGSAQGSMLGKEGNRYYGIFSVKDYDAGPAWCKVMEGFLKTFLTHTGVRRVKTEKKECIHKGDEVCSWVVSWED